MVPPPLNPPPPTPPVSIVAPIRLRKADTRGASRGEGGPELPGLAFSRPKKQIWPFFNWVGFEIFETLLGGWPFLKVYISFYSKIQNLSFHKTDFGIFQDLATLGRAIKQVHFSLARQPIRRSYQRDNHTQRTSILARIHACKDCQT